MEKKPLHQNYKDIEKLIVTNIYWPMKLNSEMNVYVKS